MKLTKQHMRILEILNHHYGATVDYIGLHNKRPLQTLSGYGLVECDLRGERWHLTEEGYHVIRECVNGEWYT